MGTQRHKAIPEARDRLQSRVLVWVVGLILAVSSSLLFLFTILIHKHGRTDHLSRLSFGISLTFGILVWALRAATPMAAFCGAMVCLLVTFGMGSSDQSPLHSGLSPLMALFVLTFAATRMGKTRKIAAGLAESRLGRNAAQVIANLGAAGMVVPATFFGYFDWASSRGGPLGFSYFAMTSLLLAALCEATADTVSSEIGQAFGGQPYLLTSFRRVDPGTDGAISLLGTASGAIAAAIVAGVGMWSMRMSLTQTAIAFTGGLAGLLFDSLLGATVERKGWLGNDLVNFSSTIFAVLVALALLAF